MTRTALFAIGAALSVALVPVAASAKAGNHNGGGKHGGGHHVGHHHHGHHNHHVRWHRWKTPVLVGSVAGAAYAATTGTAAGTCNCLTKSYLEDGTVVFKDLCTQESAMNGPANEKQAENGK
jgi:hypothetical protein